MYYTFKRMVSTNTNFNAATFLPNSYMTTQPEITDAGPIPHFYCPCPSTKYSGTSHNNILTYT